MAKYVDDQSMDAALADIADHGETLHICSAVPTDYASVGTLSLGSVALTPGDGNGDFTIQDLGAGGRRLTLAAQVVPGSANGTGTYAVIVDDTNDRIKAYTTAPNYAMVNGANQTVPAYDVYQIADPT